MLWFLAGFLIAVGVVGLLTGLPLAVVGLALTAKSIAESIAGKWRGRLDTRIDRELEAPSNVSYLVPPSAELAARVDQGR
jgi:hypothetical protein